MTKGGRRRAARTPKLSRDQYCYNPAPDPQWVIRCDRDPETGKCTSNNCVKIPASSVPTATKLGSANARHLATFKRTQS
jgi:hypothetical protein